MATRFLPSSPLRYLHSNAVAGYQEHRTRTPTKGTDKKIGGTLKAFSHGRSSLDSRIDIHKSSETLTETNTPFVPKRFFMHLGGGIRRCIGEREADACTWERGKAD